ncbi:MAG: hypothetical protein ACOYMC_05750 [Pirellulales bacterium]
MTAWKPATFNADVAAGDVPGVKVVEAGAGEVILEVGSGEYRFVGR